MPNISALLQLSLALKKQPLQEFPPKSYHDSKVDTKTLSSIKLSRTFPEAVKLSLTLPHAFCTLRYCVSSI